MYEFESYVKSNWDVANATSCGIKYTHTSRESVDKKSKVNIINHTINMTITWYDVNNVQLQTEKLSFLNDDMSKTFDKKMRTINRKELVNKFRSAKNEIVQSIIDEKREKLERINDEIHELVSYLGRQNDVIPPSMKGTIDIKGSSKQTFDM